MKVGEYSFKRRYTAAQIVVDIVSLGALAYIGYIIYLCALDIDKLKSLNRTDADMSMFDWKPLLIWAAAGAAIFAVSFVLILRNKKKPENLCITENNAVRYCNIIDTCISCVRLVLLIALGEVCYLHLSAIMMRTVSFSAQLIIDALIIVCIIIFTKMRLSALSDSEQERLQNEDKKEKYIVED